MGYFSNGSEGEAYFERYCAKCLHNGDGEGPMCPIWNLHLWHNYAECNNKESMLHELIPRENGGNGRCSMFVDAGLLSNLARQQYLANQTIAP